MMPSARHILIVNSRSVHQPVFVVGAPHSGADLIGRALKASAGFHVTIGQPSVLRTVYAFARRPSMYQGRTQAAATVIRDAFAQGWQVTPSSCLECTRECRAAAGLASDAVGPCVELRGLETFGDASPDLIYTAEALTYAFPDARIVQVIRDGRDVVASMLADPVVMSWYRPSFVNVDTEFPNPFFGIEAAEEAGIPAGVINWVPGGRELGAYLVAHPGIDKVAFTGSTAAGRGEAHVSLGRVRVACMGGEYPVGPDVHAAGQVVLITRPAASCRRPAASPDSGTNCSSEGL